MYIYIYIEDARINHEFPRYHDDPANSRLFISENIFARVIDARMHEHVCMYVYAMCNNHRKFEIGSMKRSEEVFFIVNPFPSFVLQPRCATSFSTATRRRQGWSRRPDTRILTHRGLTVRTSSRGGARNESNWYSTTSTCIIRPTRPTSKSLSLCLSPLSLSLMVTSIQMNHERERKRRGG